MVTGYYMTPVNPSTVLIPQEVAADGSTNDKLSLTSLWDYVIRTRCLPESLDLDAFFDTIHERLKSPEWEIRQNALRVLVDFMPLFQMEDLDVRISTVMPDLINNLGHLGPAVRKGAVDALKTYLVLSSKPNAITRDLVERGVEKSQANKIPTNVVLGIIMCLPFVINSKLNDTTINYIIHRLLDKIVKVVHQETVLRALVRIRNIIGSAKFDAALSTHESFNCKREFDLLCGVYDLPTFTNRKNNINTTNGNYILAKTESISGDSDDAPIPGLIKDNDKVILETEIQLQSGSSIMMKIHEENSPTSNRTFKVLPDLSLDDSYGEPAARRTPRRVRFGGEVVKLRTPDSDSNLEDNDATISIFSEGDKPVIEIKYIENETKTTTRTTRSLIPIPVKHTQSAPASPTGNSETRSLFKSKEYTSSPNLSKKASPTWGKSRIPRRRINTEIKRSVEAKIEINIKETNKVNKDLLKLPEPKDKNKKKVTLAKNTVENRERSKEVKNKEQKKKSKANPTITIPPICLRRNSREEASPVPIHNEIELFHNLTRSPSPRTDVSLSPVRTNLPIDSVIELPAIQSSQTQQELLPSNQFHSNHRPTNSETSLPIIAKSQTQNDGNKSSESDLAFHIYTSSEGPPPEDLSDSPIPVNNSGDCLTCSSSGSETGIRIERFQNAFLDDRIVEDLQNMDDMKARQRGLEELLRVIQTPTVLDSLQERLPSLFYILFSAVQQSTLQPTADEALTVIFSNMKQEVLLTRLQQICLSMAKLGSPSGIRLAIELMRRVPPKLVVDQLLSDSIIGAKSSKVREGALQIVMTVSRIYPSTDLNTIKSLRAVIKTISDKKRKVRQAALETLAALAQLTGNATVLEVAQEVTSMMESPERQQILQVIRTRLSRKQLPTVNMNGIVQYSSPQGESEIEWLSKGNSSLSSPSSPYNVVSSPSSRQKDHEEDADRNNNALVKRRGEERIVGQRFIANNEQEFSGHEQLEDSSKRRFVENYSSRSGTAEITQRKKVNYWKNNASRNHSFSDEQSGGMDSDWSSNREEPFEGQNGNLTQVWAIDPTAFTTNNGSKLSSANGTLRQVYVVKNAQNSKTASTNTDFRHETPPLIRTNTRYQSRTSRGRSFSPPTSNRTASYESFIEGPPLRNLQSGNIGASTGGGQGRFISGGHYDRNYLPKGEHERIRKSFSSEQITGLERFRKEHTFSSGSSSSSSLRHNGGNWRDLRSGIPVPIYDNKMKIRTRNHANNTTKAKGPMTIPYYPPVKSPSPASTPEKQNDANSVGRQPFSSGSESSGYFTPPPEIESHQEPAINTPDLITPQVSPQPERFVRIETPRNLESPDDDEDEEDSTPPLAIDELDLDHSPTPKSEFRGSSSLNSLNCLNTERTLSKNETTNSLEFSKATFDDISPHRPMDIDVKIVTHIRKNISSAPALNDLPMTFPAPRPATVKTTLPGSLEDVEAPEELYKSISPEKKSPAKVITVKSSITRRKSFKYAVEGAKGHEGTGDRPFTKPREAFHEISAQLDSTEWEVTMKGLQGLVRLIRHHKDLVENQIHAVCVMLGKHVRNLRSQVARNACLASKELCKVTKRPLELELDELATPLLHRTADTNKFLRTDANTALDEMCLQLSVPKLVSVITYRGSQHQNAVVRSASARLLCNMVQRLGAEKIFQLPRDTRDKILLASANGLMEGSLETRQHAKMLLGLLAEHCQFQKAMAEAVPASILRHIDKTMKLLMK